MAKGRVCLGYEVVCFLANVGQEEDWNAVEQKALAIGAKKMVIEDLQREFVEELCFRAVQCNAQYEGRYLLGTSLARPVIARALIRAAQREGCDYLSHGCTAKGNDQVRFELAFYAIQPSIKIIAPWRMSSFCDRFQGRNDLLNYAAESGIPVTSTKAKPWSMDANLAHCSYEAGILEDPDQTPPDDMWIMTDDPRNAPNEPTDITITFEKGIPTKLVTPQKTLTDSVELFKELNYIGKVHGT
ncbi:argininosuccinate synthase [Emergomyces africanus]|uniref:argininosuccinate synthase n=1 Tax=Emergomyces africanus TaxID=1955775 RepID=A0A1B7NL98_9EURO|nr:argininosuccinate synthase [Emergomyces africanus]